MGLKVLFGLKRRKHLRKVNDTARIFIGILNCILGDTMCMTIVLTKARFGIMVSPN